LVIQNNTNFGGTIPEAFRKAPLDGNLKKSDDVDLTMKIYLIAKL